MTTLIEFSPKAEIQGVRLFPYVGGSINNLILWLILHLLYSREQVYSVQQEKTKLELSSIYAKHESIKRQIQPHFLFNSLANLKTLIETERNELASEYTSSLAVFLRRSLELGQDDLVSLKDDWEFAQLYMEIQQLRFGDSLQVDSNLSDSPLEELKIPVFAMQLVIENVYKHNVISESNPLTLKIQYNETNQSIRVKNPIRAKGNVIGSGVGLKNLQERSLHLTGKNPIVERTDNYFEITLFCNQA